MYAMQSSGASLVAFLASQGERIIGVVDLWNPEVAPDIDAVDPVVLKTTTGPVRFGDHVASFSPTATVLVLRHPVDQISTLTRECYRDYAAPIEKKLEDIEDAFVSRDSFDLVLRYEDVVLDTAAAVAHLRRTALPLSEDADLFPRSVAAVVDFACVSSRWCQAAWRTKWGTGRVDPATRSPLCLPSVEPAPDSLELAQRHCPSLLAYYEA